MAIPRIIHQTVADRSGVHPLIAENLDRIRELNPDWEHRLYEDEDCRRFIRDHYGRDTLALYERIDPRYGPARADLFRYLLIHEVGGVYLDAKSTLRRPLSEVLRPDDRYLLSEWKNAPGESHEGFGVHARFGVSSEYQNWHIVAEPGHPFLDAVIRLVTKRIEDYHPLFSRVGRSGVLLTTGPIAYTQAIRPIRHEHPHRLVDIGELGFEYSIVKTRARKPDHRRLFDVHYTRLRLPVVRIEPRAGVLTRFNYLVFTAYGRCDLFLRRAGVHRLGAWLKRRLRGPRRTHPGRR